MSKKYIIVKTSIPDSRDWETAIILEVDEAGKPANENSKKIKDTLSNGDVVFVNNVNQFHPNFGKSYKTLEEAENALQEIFQSQPNNF